MVMITAPGTIQGVIWYGDDCEDENGNIGSDDCSQLVGRFCFVAGDTLEWPVEVDQSISSDICDACWMSEPAGTIMILNNILIHCYFPSIVKSLIIAIIVRLKI